MTSDAPDDFPADLAAPSLVDFERLAEIPTVCGSLLEAMGALEADYGFPLQGDVYTRDQIDGYMDPKWEEIYRYEHTPHPVEFQMYDSC